jgi:exopolysaccharide biosynthesis protein
VAKKPTANTTTEAVASSITFRPFENSTERRSDHVWRTWEEIGGVGVNVVYVNTKPQSVRFLTGFGAGADPIRGYFPRENFYRTVKRYKPRVAINGTYFHLTNGEPTGAIVRHGDFLYDGRWGTTICIDRKGRVSFRYQSGTLGRHRGWAGVENAISTGPTLVRDSRLYLHPRKEGFRDPSVLGTARRSALGLTSDNRLVLVTVHTPVSLNKLANIMLALDCKAAANLDGGSSSALYCNGEFITKPQRALSNVLLIYD